MNVFSWQLLKAVKKRKRKRKKYWPGLECRVWAGKSCLRGAVAVGIR